MKMTPRSAGAVTAAGGLLFLVLTFGVQRFENLLHRLVDVSLPGMLLDCCGCAGIALFALPLALLALTLFRQPDEPPK